MDFWEGVEKFGDNQPVMGTLYITSGVTTIGASVAIFLAATFKAAGSAGLAAAFSVVGLWWVAGVLGVIAIAATIAIWWSPSVRITRLIHEADLKTKMASGFLL
ncbi:hypothetical protein [Halomonas mongoliensis]|uniref:hypothetical protein n=1 Tax=Halomonas mongoliensis TaxID=321265 RepID=UPI00403ADD7E